MIAKGHEAHKAISLASCTIFSNTFLTIVQNFPEKKGKLGISRQMNLRLIGLINLKQPLFGNYLMNRKNYTRSSKFYILENAWSHQGRKVTFWF